MEKRPIEALMGTTMESIKDMVDVNTVVGEYSSEEVPRNGYPCGSVAKGVYSFRQGSPRLGFAAFA